MGGARQRPGVGRGKGRGRSRSRVGPEARVGTSLASLTEPARRHRGPAFRSRFTASAAQRHPPLTPEPGPHPHPRSANAPREGPAPRTNRGDSSATPRPTPPGGPRGSRPALPRLRPPGSPRCSAAADARDVTRRGGGMGSVPHPHRHPRRTLPELRPPVRGPADTPGGLMLKLKLQYFAT
ncbi:proline-rich protein 2-like [Bubalus bubalis]|uniref:proline-rich protein 2-like n=1 Tax=Bubalus bubalis TaxID=89462 RepID=UPI000DBC494E|nr:proline-rich protein 2-like [Bubalus bubalis]XP_045022454.1 proline-rich protein 2-like [Bubalus bubalis]